MKTYGRFIDDMVIKAPVAMKFALGENPKSVYHEKNETPTTRMATAALIREQLAKTREYIEKKKRAQEEGELCEFDAKLEALEPLFTKGLPIHIHAHRADDICTAMRIAEEFSLNYAVVHCTQGHKIADALAKRHVAAMSGPLISERCKPGAARAHPGHARHFAKGRRAHFDHHGSSSDPNPIFADMRRACRAGGLAL